MHINKNKDLVCKSRKKKRPRWDVTFMQSQEIKGRNGGAFKLSSMTLKWILSGTGPQSDLWLLNLSNTGGISYAIRELSSSG